MKDLTDFNTISIGDSTSIIKEKKCRVLCDKIQIAFEEQSGGQWNDTMAYQAEGAREEINEARADGGTNEDWDYALNNLTKCWKYQSHCAKLDKMSTNLPEAVYG